MIMLLLSPHHRRRSPCVATAATTTLLLLLWSVVLVQAKSNINNQRHHHPVSFQNLDKSLHNGQYNKAKGASLPASTTATTRRTQEIRGKAHKSPKPPFPPRSPFPTRSPARSPTRSPAVVPPTPPPTTVPAPFTMLQLEDANGHTFTQAACDLDRIPVDASSPVEQQVAFEYHLYLSSFGTAENDNTTSITKNSNTSVGDTTAVDPVVAVQHIENALQMSMALDFLGPCRYPVPTTGTATPTLALRAVASNPPDEVVLSKACEVRPTDTACFVVQAAVTVQIVYSGGTLRQRVLVDDKITDRRIVDTLGPWLSRSMDITNMDSFLTSGFGDGHEIVGLQFVGFTNIDEGTLGDVPPYNNENAADTYRGSVAATTDKDQQGSRSPSVAGVTALLVAAVGLVVLVALAAKRKQTKRLSAHQELQDDNDYDHDQDDMTKAEEKSVNATSPDMSASLADEFLFHPDQEEVSVRPITRDVGNVRIYANGDVSVRAGRDPTIGGDKSLWDASTIEFREDDFYDQDYDDESLTAMGATSLASQAAPLALPVYVLSEDESVDVSFFHSNNVVDAVYLSPLGARPEDTQDPTFVPANAQKRKKASRKLKNTMKAMRASKRYYSAPDTVNL